MVVLGKPASTNFNPKGEIMYKVKTRDVDCSTSRSYKTRAAAIARFESMLGYTMQNAIEEHYHATPVERQPKADTVKFVRGVSMFGTVVVFEQVEA